jgi:PucR C-terminal helix-turn-helix domain/GGDEF-like domain
MVHRVTKSVSVLGGQDAGAGSAEAARAGLAARLRARRSEIEEAVLARFGEIGFDPATGEDARYVAGSGAAVAESVDYGLRAIERGQEWFGSIPPAAVAQVYQAARNGVSLDKVLLRTNAAHTVLEDFIVQEVDFATESAVLRGVFGTLGALLDHFTAVMAHEYQRELERATRRPELRCLERVRRLLAGGELDAVEPGYELDGWHLGVIAVGVKARETLRALASGVGRPLLSVSPEEGTVWAWFGGRRPLASAEVERLLSARTPSGVSLSVGVCGKGIDGWRLTHRQAQAAMLVAVRRSQRLTSYADVALLAAVLRDPELASSLMAVYLSPLDGHKDGTVSRDTLRAYLAVGCNAASAAGALKVDRHTVERRLAAIESRLGRSVQVYRAELEVALRLEELGEPSVPPGDSRLG